MNAVVLLFGVVVLAAIPVLLRRPTWAVFLFAFLLLAHVNLVLSSELGFGLADPLLFGAMLGLVSVYPLLHGDRGRGSGRFLAASALWLAAVLNSFIWSTAAGVSVGALVEFLPNLLYAWVLFLMITDRTRLMAALAGIVAATIFLSVLTILKVSLPYDGVSFLGFAQGEVDHIAGQVDAIRPSGPVRDPNYYCQILVPGFALALGIALAARTGRWRAAGLVAAVLITVAILLTASRGGLLAAAVATVGLLLAHRKIQYLAVVAVPAIALLYFVPSYYDRVTSVTTAIVALASGQNAGETSVSGRLAEMRAAAILFAEHPVSGIGYGMFETRYQAISANYDMMLRGEDRSAHSLYLETAAEQGAVGLAALLFLLGGSLRSVQLAQRQMALQKDVLGTRALQSMVAGAAGLFLSALFLHDAYAQHFWLVLAVLFAAERAIRQNPIRVEPRVDMNV